jgi:hypothetical protein
MLSQVICPVHAFPANYNVCGQSQEPSLEWSTWEMLHSGKLKTYPKTTMPKKLASDKHASLLRT